MQNRIIKEVIEALRSHFEVEVEERVNKDENVKFNLPKVLAEVAA